MGLSRKVNGAFWNCNYLDMNLDKEEAEKYYSQCMNKYKSFFKDDSENKTIMMANRSIRARREIISSARLFEEAKTSYNHGCISATYFSTYYSLFHAMWAVLFLDPLRGNDIVEITHSKLKNIFCDCYTRVGFFDVDMEEFILNLKDIREFYSYNIPYNMINSIDFNMLETILLKCYQLANLHNNIISVCIKKIPVSEDNISRIYEYYELFNGRKDHDGNANSDPAEDGYLYEMLRYGVGIDFFDTELGHDWDEMGYGNSDERHKINSKAMSLIYKAIPYV